MNEHRDGTTNDDEPMYEWQGNAVICVCCGGVKEGTASFTIWHWNHCTGIVAYGRMTAMGVEPAVAAVVARQLHREVIMPSVLDGVVRNAVGRNGMKEILKKFQDLGREVDPAFKILVDRKDRRGTIMGIAAWRALRATEKRTIDRVITTNNVAQKRTAPDGGG